jgi:O-antigen ligase
MLYALAFLALGLAWLLPGHYFPWTTFQQEALAAAGAGLLVLGALIRTAGPLGVPAASAFAAALAVLPLVQAATGKLPYLIDGLLPALYLVGFAVTAVAAQAATRTEGPRLVAGMWWTLLVAAILSAGIALAQWFEVGVGTLPYTEFAQGTRVFANFGQPNHLALLLVLGLIGLAWCYETGRISAVTGSLAAALLLLALAGTRSRAAWLFAVVVILLWSGLQRRSEVTTSARTVITWALVFGLLSAVAGWLNRLADVGAFQSFEERIRGGTRSTHWATLWDAAWREPWFGYGWMQVTKAQQAATLDHPATREWIVYSHNLVLDLMIWNGAMLGSLLSACLVLWLGRRVIACRSREAFFLVLAVGVLAAHSAVEFPLAYLFFLLPCGVMVGMLSAVAPAGADNILTARRRLVVPVWAATLSLTGWIGLEYMRVESASRDMAFWEARYRTPSGPPQPPNTLLVDGPRELVWFRRTEATPAMAPEDVGRMMSVVERYSPPPALLRYALAAGLNNRPDEALRALSLVCHMFSHRNCDEGRDSWGRAQARYPQLGSIAYPRTSEE